MFASPEVRKFRARLFQVWGLGMAIAAPIITVLLFVTGEGSLTTFGMGCAVLLAGLGLRTLGWILEKVGR